LQHWQKSFLFKKKSNIENGIHFFAESKYGGDEEDDCDICLCTVLVIGTLVLVSAIFFTLGLLVANIASQMLFPDPSVYEVKATPPLFPISSIHERIFAKNKEFPVGIK